MKAPLRVALGALLTLAWAGGPTASRAAPVGLGDARYRETIAAWATDLSDPALDAKTRRQGEVVVATAWMEEGILAGRTAVLEGYVLLRLYPAYEAEHARLKKPLTAAQKDLLQFYSGLSRLLTGDRGGAAANFRAVAGASLKARARVWELASTVPEADLPGQLATLPRTGEPGLEAAYAAFAVAGVIPDVLPEVATPSARDRQILGLLRWARGEAGHAGGGSFASDRLDGPEGSLEKMEERIYLLYDPWLLRAYSRACLMEARAGAPDPADFLALKERALDAGRLAFAEGNYGEAERLFGRVGGDVGDAWRDLSRGLASGTGARPVLERLVSRDKPDVLAAQLALLLFRNEVQWTEAGPLIDDASRRWVASFEAREEKITGAQMRAGLWCAGAALWWGGGDIASARDRLAGALDPLSVGDPRRNPPLRLPEIVLGGIHNFNRKHEILQACAVAAKRSPFMQDVHAALQSYFNLVDPDPERPSLD